MAIPIPSSGQYAVVTGASHGIGTALAKELADRGHNLILVARRRDALAEVAAHIESVTNVSVEVYPADLADANCRALLCKELSSRRISVLCNNAGVAIAGPLGSHDVLGERELVQLNVVAVHELLMAVLPGMLGRQAGGILFSGSLLGDMSIPNLATYTATKAFDNVLAESLHHELRRTGVHVTLLASGPVRTYDPDQLAPPLLKFVEKLPDWFLLEPRYTALKSLDALQSNRLRVTPGIVAKAMSMFCRYVPAAVASPTLGAIFKQLDAHIFPFPKFSSAPTCVDRGREGGYGQT